MQAMKWLKFIMLILCINAAVAQSPNYNGGNEDGTGIGILTVGTFFALYQGGNGDGYATAQLGQPTVFDMFRGGGADGFAWNDGNSPLQVNMYAGQTGDGFAIGVLTPPTYFNMYNGGVNDGNAASALTTGLACNLYNGGNNDGFAWNDGNSPLQVNFYNGGVNDGYAYTKLNSATAFNLYAGGINDGVGIGKLTPATSFSFYNGGIKDGFALYRYQPCKPITGVTANFTSITANGATFNWTAINEGAEYSVKVYVSGNPVFIQNNTGVTSAGLNSVPLTSLAPNTNYCVTVEEKCDATRSAGVSNQFCFTTASSSTCAMPTSQGIWFTSGQYLMVKWLSALYGNSSKSYEIAGGLSITSPEQATTRQINGYYISQTPAYPSYPFFTGNVPGFTWYVRDICNPGDTSAWLGPYVVGSSKTDGSEATAIIEEDEQNTATALILYPNPNTDGRLYIKATDLGDNTPLFIYSVEGQLALQTNIVNNAVDVSALSNGVYLLRIETPAYNTKLKKLVIQH